MAPGSEALPAAGRDRGTVSLSSWLRQRRHFSAITDTTGRIVEFGCFDQPGLGPPAGIIGTYLPEELLATPLAHDHWPAREFEFHAGQTYCVSRAHLHAEQPNIVRILWTFQPGATVHSAAGTTGVPNQVSDFMAAMPIIVWESAPDRKGILFNRAWYEFTGRPALLETVAGWADCVHPDDITAARVAFDNAVAQRSLCTSEYRLRRHDGEFCWVLDIARARYSPAGEFAGFVGAIIDIEPAKRIESALQSAEQRWKFALESSTSGVFDWNPQSGTLVMSRQAKAMLGFQDAELGIDAAQWCTMVHPDDRDAARAEVVAYRTGAIAEHHRELRIQCSDGRYKWIQNRGRVVERLADGRPARVIGVVDDISELKEMAESLRQREQHLLLAMGHAQMAWYSRDTETLKVMGSPSLAAIYDLEDPIGPWDIDVFQARMLPEDLPLHIRELARASNGPPAGEGKTNLFEMRIRRRDGEIRHLEVRYRFERVDSRHRAFGIVFDTTDSKRTEFALRDIDARLQLALGHASMAWFERNIATGLLTGSPSLWLIYGLDPRHGPLHFSDIEDRMHPADRARHPGAAAKLRAGYWDHDRTSVLTYRVRRADGSYGWVEVRYRVSLEANEGQGGVYGLVIDITANKANEIALRESEARLRLALQAANMASWHWDFNSDLVTSSDRLDELLGLSTWGPWSSESLIRQVAEPDRDGLQIALGDLRTGRKGALDREIRVVAARGDERWIEIRAEVDYSTQGVLSAAHGIAIDISNRKRIEAERMALEGQLRQAQKMEAIGELTGGIAHDFNNILSSILGYTGLAQLKFRDSVSPKLDEYLSEIRAAGERARDMIMHMLAFSRGQPREVADADLPGLVETTIKMLRPTLPASITLQFESEVESARATVDPIQLQQVLINLSINARDAMTGQGHIDIRLALLHIPGSRCSSCHANFGGTYLSLSVSDTGPGIPNAVLERIFEPFYSTKPVGEGTGMGLAMAHGIVHRHGGHIRVESRSRIGTRFEILLPPGNGDNVVVAGTERTDEAAPEGGLCGEVLVVDDEPALGRYVGELLELHGIKVSVEQNPRRALSLLLESPRRFDVLITDHTMPELSGVHLAQEALAVRPGFPIILLTGYSAVVDRNQAQALGIRAYFDKPVCGDELVATVQALIRERSTLLPPGAGAEGLGLAAEALASQALHDARELR